MVLMDGIRARSNSEGHLLKTFNKLTNVLRAVKSLTAGAIEIKKKKRSVHQDPTGGCEPLELDVVNDE